jgi:hypothetical protein
MLHQWDIAVEVQRDVHEASWSAWGIDMIGLACTISGIRYEKPSAKRGARA